MQITHQRSFRGMCLQSGIWTSQTEPDREDRGLLPSEESVLLCERKGELVGVFMVHPRVGLKLRPFRSSFVLKCCGCSRQNALLIHCQWGMNYKQTINFIKKKIMTVHFNFYFSLLKIWEWKRPLGSHCFKISPSRRDAHILTHIM